MGTYLVSVLTEDIMRLLQGCESNLQKYESRMDVTLSTFSCKYRADTTLINKQPKKNILYFLNS